MLSVRLSVLAVQLPLVLFFGDVFPWPNRNTSWSKAADTMIVGVFYVGNKCTQRI